MFSLGLAELMVLLVLIAVVGFWLWVIIDILCNEFTGYNKIIWLLAVLLAPPIGASVYFLFGRRQKTIRRPK